MNFSSLLAGRLRIAAPPALAILLMIALAGSALANPPGASDGQHAGDGSPKRFGKPARGPDSD